MKISIPARDPNGFHQQYYYIPSATPLTPDSNYHGKFETKLDDEVKLGVVNSRSQMSRSFIANLSHEIKVKTVFSY